MTALSDLPYIDEHATRIAAGVHEVWPVLLDAIDGAFSGTVVSTYARVIRTSPRTSSGPRPLAAGSTVSGFTVVAASPGEELVLAGRHTFSTYALTFRLAPDGGATGSTLTAESRAAFPGLPGRAYRLAVIRTGAHAMGMRRLLAAIRTHSEVDAKLNG